MNIQKKGVPTRPKLTLPFGRMRTEQAETNPGLSPTELRRVVAIMIG